MREIRNLGEGRSHWKLAGPGDVSVEWDAATTRQIPNELLEWKTLPGQAVQHAGLVRFRSSDGGTTVDLRMTYNPPMGALGHVMAMLFGTDPKSELEQGMMRMKNFIETERAPQWTA